MKIGCVERDRAIKKKQKKTKKKTIGKRRKVSREKRARKLESTPKYAEREREQEKTQVKR